MGRDRELLMGISRENKQLGANGKQCYRQVQERS